MPSGFYSGLTSGTTTSSLVWPKWVTASNYATNTITTATNPWNDWVHDQYVGTGMTNGTETLTAATTYYSNQIIWGRWTYNQDTGTATARQTIPYNDADMLFDPNGNIREAARLAFQRWAAQNAETQEQRAARELREAEDARLRAAAEAERQRLWLAGEPERARQRLAMEEQARARDAKRLAAHKRAMELLYLVLSATQKKMLEEKKFFYVDAPSGRRYRIDQGNHQNVRVVDKVTGVIVESLCVQPDGLPDGDVMLIQKLLIETAEQAFRDTANISRWDTGARISSSKHLLTGDKLAEILKFPEGGRVAVQPAPQVEAA